MKNYYEYNQYYEISNTYYHRIPKKILKFWASQGYYNPRKQDDGWIVASHVKFNHKNIIERLGYCNIDYVAYFLDGRQYSENDMLRMLTLKAFW